MLPLLVLTILHDVFIKFLGYSVCMTDPRKKYEKPPFPDTKEQVPPATDTEMEPKSDYGETSYEGSGLLRDRVAIITGGDSGIGKAVALAFAREGADVVIAYLDAEKEGKDAEEAAVFVEEAGRSALLIAGDIGDESFCMSLVERTLTEFGKLDILVNNAAYQRTYASITDIPAEEIEAAFRTNVYGTFFLTKVAFPHMQPGSSIINTASVQSVRPSTSLLPYACTKGALKTFTEAFSQEAITKGVRVNAVAPGPVWTPLIPSTMPNAQEFGKGNPTGRPAQPAEIAPLFVLLASDRASYVNGEMWGVTGGSMSAK